MHIIEVIFPVSMLQKPMKASYILCSVIPLFVWPMSTSSKQWLLLWVVASDRVGNIREYAGREFPKIALKWMPKQTRARGRSKKNWMEGIRKVMNERNLNEGQWEDMKQWSLGVGQRRKTF